MLALFRIVAALAVLATTAPAWAAASLWAQGAQSEVRLVAAVTATGTLDTVPLGLEFRLAPGWKIYWRSPGDAGYPPRLDWSGSGNLAGTRIDWPLPHRFTVLGLQTVGYKDTVVLPIAASPRAPGKALRLRALVEYLACAEVCIPEQASLALDLPAGPAQPSPFAHSIDRWAKAVPGDGAGVGLDLTAVTAHGAGDAALVTVAVRGQHALGAPDVFIESAEGLQFGPPQRDIRDGGRQALLTAKVAPGLLEGSLVGRSLTVTVADGARGLERTVTVTAGQPPSPAEGGLPGLLGMLALALVGGLILNLMPCVLPVLSIKLLGILGHGGGARAQIRLSFIASAAGIVASFLALAAVAVALKAAGIAVGWGIQFQQPLFLVALVVVCTLFAANLWGLFEIPLPHWLGGAGKGDGAPRGLGGHFAAGAFATLLATPCSAPFLGTAVGFALARGPGEIFAVFAALGLGMAAPYLLVALWPGLVRRLPRPGAWMLWLRRGLGVALAVTGLWLLYVLSVQAGDRAALAVGLLMAAMPALLALRLRLGATARPVVAGAVAVVAALAFVPPLQATAPVLDTSAKGASQWSRFDRGAITTLVAEGKTVFVDVTAEWCITCQVNKAAVINRGAVAERLADPKVVPMRADWTSPDDAIAGFLASYGRYGIPFNVVYGPAAPEGVVLPELLSEAAVLDALAKAAGPAR